MPGVTVIIRSLPSLRKKYEHFETDELRRAWLHGKLSDFYLKSEYCILYVIDYLGVCCHKKATKKDIEYYLGKHVPDLENDMRRLKSSGHVIEDNKSGELTIVP
jgi:hypothetical protein